MTTAVPIASQDKLPPRVTATLDFDKPGKQFGYLRIPYSHDASAWGSILEPVVVIANGRGPTLLFTGGNHGDEYEGQIALMKLCRALDPAQLEGRLIVIPCLNLPAVRSGTRLSPIDGLNMNRVFPGRREGSVTELIAHYVSQCLLPLADAVVDLHSGGKTLQFLPAAIIHRVSNAELMSRSLAALKAFAAPVGLVLVELDSAGMLDTAVENMGKLFISTELGGGGTVTRETVAIAERGVRNLLMHFGVIGNRGSGPAQPSTRLMHTPDGASYVTANANGIFEILVDLGQDVEAGDAVGQIHFFEQPELPPVVQCAGRSGTVVCRHVPGLVQRGDCIAVIAADMPADETHGS
jgi:N-alpha-acetyl-L-2,4-diaminobutyrate deacetylase